MKTHDEIAYEAGWRASMRPTADLDRAEVRFDRTHGSAFDPCCMFSGGWVDYAAGNPKGTALLPENHSADWHRRNHPEEAREA